MSTIEFSNRLIQFQLFMYNFALRLTRNEDRAKDLVQETSIRAFRYREKFKPGTNFKGWIATVMRNLFINHYRKEARRRTVNEPVEQFEFALESKVITPNEGEANLRLAELYRQINSIGKIYSVPFLMHFRGYEYQEIAERLDLPMGTVKSRIHTARQKIRLRIASRKA